jgi:hypothetical protein
MLAFLNRSDTEWLATSSRKPGLNFRPCSIGWPKFPSYAQSILSPFFATKNCAYSWSGTRPT